MRLSDALDTEGSGTPTRCRTCLYLDGAAPEDRAALLGALHDPSVSHTRIARALTAVGYPISPNAVGRHRNWCDESSRPAGTRGAG